jgi:deoxyribonuclease-4
VQLFTHAPNQWRGLPILPEHVRRFREALVSSGLVHPLVHDGYLINLASPDPALWRRSVDGFVEELRRAATLRIPYVVTHPGAYSSGGEQQGLKRVILGLNEALALTAELKVGCLLETTAGQGTWLGWRFEQLAAIFEGVESQHRLGVCFDTCHVFAAGYPLATEDQYHATMREFDAMVGIGRLKAFHLNDSRGPLGSRIDRHAHIGHGHIGLSGFRHLLSDPRFAAVPMYLETPKGQTGGEDWDLVNLRTLRQMCSPPPTSSEPQ